MQIKICDIPREGLNVSYEQAPGGFSESPFIMEGPIRVELGLTKHNDQEVLIQGSISANFSCECSRCLGKFTEPIASHFVADYVPLSKMPKGQAHELLSGDLDLHFYHGDAIQVDELIRSYLYLSAPMRPLCTDGCLGLCFQCGANLNEETCPCPKTSSNRMEDRVQGF